MRDASVLQYIGSRLKAERERLGYSQADIAAVAGCSQAQYSRFERGERELGALQLHKLAVELQLPLTSFFPVNKTATTDASEEKLVEAWRAGNLARILSLVAERFA